MNPSRPLDLIDFYLAPRLAALIQQHAMRALLGAKRLFSPQAGCLAYAIGL